LDVQESDADLTDDLPDEVVLSRQDAAFSRKKAQLKAAVYRFDGRTRTWKRPQAA